MNWVWTVEGLVPREELELREAFEDSEDNCVHKIEFWKGDKLMKRAVEVHLKRGLNIKSEVASNGE